MSDSNLKKLIEILSSMDRPLGACMEKAKHENGKELTEICGDLLSLQFAAMELIFEVAPELRPENEKP